METPAAPESTESTEAPSSSPVADVDLPDGFEFVEPEPEVAEVPQLSEETLSSLEMPDQAAFLDEIESEPVDEDESSEVESGDIAEELPPLPSPTDQAMSDPVWGEAAPETDETTAETAATEQDQDTEQESDQGSDGDSEGITGEAARTAFDALFSDGASSWGSAFLTNPKPEESISQSKEEDAGDGFGTGLDEPVSTEGGDDGSEEESDRPKRKRSRRRRRGGKGRKPVGEGAAESESSEATSAAKDERGKDDAGESRQKPKRRRPAPRARATEDVGDSDFDEALNESEAKPTDDAPTRRQRHRNIPTWSEAIGMIVDANLEQRAKSPSKPQSSRGRGGRGGRRRGGGKKSENK